MSHVEFETIFTSDLKAGHTTSARLRSKESQYCFVTSKDFLLQKVFRDTMVLRKLHTYLSERSRIDVTALDERVFAERERSRAVRIFPNVCMSLTFIILQAIVDDSCVLCMLSATSAVWQCITSIYASTTLYISFRCWWIQTSRTFVLLRNWFTQDGEREADVCWNAEGIHKIINVSNIRQRLENTRSRAGCAVSRTMALVMFEQI